MEEERDEIRRFVADLSRQTGLSLTALAKRAGVAATTLTRFMNSDEVDHVLSSTTLAKLRRLARMGGMDQAVQAPDLEEPARHRRMIVVREFDVSAQAGTGADLEPLDGSGSHTVVGQWQLPEDYLRAFTPSTSQLAVIRVEGDSMEPEFSPGERVLVDCSKKSPSPPGIFVVWDGLGLVLKRVELLLNSEPKRLRLTSSNAAYLPYEVDLDGAVIAGRVIGKWQWR